MISFGVHCRVQMFQAWRNHLVFCELMASGPMVPHSFPGLLEDTWPGPHLCCIKLVADSNLGRFCSWPGCCSQDCQICIVAYNPCVCPHCLRNSWACKCWGCRVSLGVGMSHFISLRRSTRYKFPAAAPSHLCGAPQCHPIQRYISGWSWSLRRGLIS